MPRDFDQIMRSRETDSWKLQFHGYVGTTVGGTISLSIAPITGRDLQFVTGLSFAMSAGLARQKGSSGSLRPGLFVLSPFYPGRLLELVQPLGSHCLCLCGIW